MTAAQDSLGIAGARATSSPPGTRPSCAAGAIGSRRTTACLSPAKTHTSHFILVARGLKQPFLGAWDPLEKFHVQLQPVTWLRLLIPLPPLLVRLVLRIGGQPDHSVNAENSMHRRPGNRKLVKAFQVVGDLAELSSWTFRTSAREFSPLSTKRDRSTRLRLGVLSQTRSDLNSEGSVWSGSPCGRRQGRSSARHSGWQLERRYAALTEVVHDADRLASRRARRAAAARDVRSLGTASPVPKYISFGVCPRNAECGSTWLCSWT